jgi:hypothetical protein
MIKKTMESMKSYTTHDGNTIYNDPVTGCGACTEYSKRVPPSGIQACEDEHRYSIPGFPIQNDYNLDRQ